MRLTEVVLAGALILDLTTPAAGASWPELIDVRIASTAATDAADVMICIVGADGEARCHHRGGVSPAKVHATGRATCTAASRARSSPCPGGVGCLFAKVSVPSEAFGLLVLKLVPPLFGVPRNSVIDTALVSGARPSASGSARPSADGEPIGPALRALARCLAPPGAGHPPAVRALDRAACETRACELRQSLVTLAPHHPKLGALGGGEALAGAADTPRIHWMGGR